jgi:hypothetical protein
MMASLVLDGATDPVLSQLAPHRFKSGNVILEPLLNQE